MHNVATFEEKVAAVVSPIHSSKETARHIVIAALETEFGKAFTMSPNFAKMVNTLAEVIVTNPELRNQSQAVASYFIKKNRDHQTNRTI